MNTRRILSLTLGFSAVLAASAIVAAPQQHSTPTRTPVRFVQEMNSEQHDLYTSMRKLWEDHVAWTRHFIVSSTSNLPNKRATTNRLLQNQVEIGNAIKPIYGDAAGNRLTSLLRDHILIAADVISAAKRNDSDGVTDQKAKWYQNADEIADFLSEANPRNWPRAEMRSMMHEHLDLTLDEAVAELNGDYMGSVRKYDQVRVQILKMSDMLSEGIVNQFPNKFASGPYFTNPIGNGYTALRIDAGTVIPFKLQRKLSSNRSAVGDRFTASLDTAGSTNYEGIPAGAVLEGHVDVVRPKTGNTPGVLGLAFDRVRMPDGQSFPVYGTLIGLDSKSVENDDGRLVAKQGAKTDNLKYVGYGAGGGALVALLTKGNVISNTLIGGALGYLYGEIQRNPSKSRNVTLEVGTRFGVKSTRDLLLRVPTVGNR